MPPPFKVFFNLDLNNFDKKSSKKTKQVEATFDNLNKLDDKRRIIIYSIIVSMLIGISYILFSTQLYRSYITLYPAGELSGVPPHSGR